MNTTNVIDILGESLRNTIELVLGLLPSFIFAFILVLIGIMFANILSRATTHILADLLKLDNILDKSGLGHFLNDSKISVSKFFAVIVKWGLILAFFAAAARVLKLDVFVDFLNDLIDYIPSVLSASIVIIISVLVADALSKIVMSASRSVNMNGSIASAVTRYSIFVWGIVTALAQLQVRVDILIIAISGAVFALSLAFGLAFGLGGRDAAAKMLEKMKDHF